MSKGFHPLIWGVLPYWFIESFIYHQYIKRFDVSFFQDILSFADMYRIEGLMSPCESFLISQLDPSNALGIWLFADFRNLQNLKNQAQSFLHHHFLRVCDWLIWSTFVLFALLGSSVISFVPHLNDQRRFLSFVMLYLLRFEVIATVYSWSVSILPNSFARSLGN